VEWWLVADVEKCDNMETVRLGVAIGLDRV